MRGITGLGRRSERSSEAGGKIKEASKKLKQKKSKAIEAAGESRTSINECTGPSEGLERKTRSQLQLSQ